MTLEHAASIADFSDGELGVGLAFVDGDDLVGIDLDVRGISEREDQARALITEICESLVVAYAERSCSGSGYHVLLRGNAGWSRGKRGAGGWIDVFIGRGYFTMLGQGNPTWGGIDVAA